MSFLIPHFQKRSLSPWSELERFFDSQESEKFISLANDIEDAEDHILISFDLPGMKESDFSVKVSDGVLRVSGERKREEKKTEKSQIVYSRRSYGKFEKSFSLPENVDEKNVEADYREGVLRLYLPKLQEVKTEQIDVKIKNKDSFFDRLNASTKN